MSTRPSPRNRYLFVVGGSLTLFALRAPVVKSQVGFNLWSRETLLLGNNLVLVVSTATILLGTLYPLILDATTGAKLSVGPPYFNALFLPLMAVLMLAMAVGVLVRWKDTPMRWLLGMLAPVLLTSVALGVLACVLLGDFNWAVLAVVFLAAWVVLAGVRDFGTYSADSCDYPAFIRPTAEAVARGEFDRGIVLGGSGNGEAIVANKVKGIRCGLCWSEETALANRDHNDGNVLALGERMVSLELALKIVQLWLETPFSNDPRHVRRIRAIEG